MFNLMCHVFTFFDKFGQVFPLLLRQPCDISFHDIFHLATIGLMDISATNIKLLK